MITVRKGDVIRIVPERGPERVMIVSHVEHHVITLIDHPQGAALEDPEFGRPIRLRDEFDATPLPDEGQE
jgi:hypothetical protein